MIGKIQRVLLREVWKHEAYDFTQWLQENLDVLSDVLGFSLSNAEREQAAGDFSVDLVAEDASGNPVIIENQLEKSNHDHLSKLITYLVAVGARKAVWIVEDPRPEHVSALSWLNESSVADFYLLKLEAIKIGDSPPAPLLTRIVGPSEQTREAGKTKRELAERYIIRQRFWSDLLERAKTKTKLHANISPSQYNELWATAGRQGLSYMYAIRQHEASVELYIDRGKESDEENKQILDILASHKDAIESAFGGPLEWESKEGRRACRIWKQIVSGGYRDEERWPEIHDQMIEAMIRLEQVLKPYIAQLKI
ncbi:MAG: DUF4268 domain-containing protein [Candidatus Tectomicrobia bacterium]|nr:DUF4268 domain-containing protein [Candidatus Tectomicrobia bacterium]